MRNGGKIINTPTKLMYDGLWSHYDEIASKLSNTPWWRPFARITLEEERRTTLKRIIRCGNYLRKEQSENTKNL